MSEFLRFLAWALTVLAVGAVLYVAVRIMSAAYFHSKERFVRRLTDGNEE